MGEKHGVVRHLRFARQWLEQAEQEFSKNNPVRGELTLSLVLGEVRRAWEMSRQGRSLRRPSLVSPGGVDARPRGRLLRAAAWGGGLLVVALAILWWQVQPAADPVFPAPVAAVTPAPAAPVPQVQSPAPAGEAKAKAITPRSAEGGASVRQKAVATSPPAAEVPAPLVSAKVAPAAGSSAAADVDPGTARAVKGAAPAAGGGAASASAEPAAPETAASPAAAEVEASRPAPAPRIEVDLNQLVKLAFDSLRGSAGRP